MRKDQHLGFTIASRMVGGIMKPFATFTCRCGETLALPQNGKIVPEHVAKAAERQGWRAGAYANTATRCVTCLTRRSPGESPKESIEIMAEKKVATLTIPPPQPLREPTQAERAAIRDKITESFDDATNKYLPGWSDQRIGEVLNLPWAMVRVIREAWWGPLNTSDPERDALEKDMADLKKAVKDHADKAMEDAANLMNRLTNLEARMEKITAA